MALKKNPKYDLKAKYSRVLEICMISSLIFLVAAFKFLPSIETAEQIRPYSPDIPIVVEIPLSGDPPQPPPPPKPPIPIEAPDTEQMPDIEIEPTDCFQTDIVTAPPPPLKDTDEVIFEYIKVVEQLPQPIGGLAALQAQIVYPEIAVRAGVQGQVQVKAYVDENGVVQKVELLKGIGAGCDEEALKAVMNTHFSPGLQRGKPVKVQVTIPIKFVLR